ncbi:uncharacterized protein LOC120331132 [Styela clava]
MILILYLTLLLGANSMAQEKTEEEKPIGIRLSATEWYPNSYSLEVSEQLKQFEDIRCKLVTSAVKSALFMKRLGKTLTEDEMQKALRNFESCKASLCQNTAMLDQFMKPETFQEQIDILIVQVKMPTISKEDRRHLLRGLVNAKYWSDVNGPFPGYEEESKVHQQDMVRGIIETTCGTQPDDLANYIRQNDITTVFLFSLVDRYTSGTVTEQDAKDLIYGGTDFDKNDIWGKIADRIFSVDSNFASTCLDPALGFYDVERPSVTRIRKFAEDMNIYCEKPEPPVISKSEAFEEEEIIMSAGPPSSNNRPSGSAPGSPGSSGSSTGGAPGSPGSSGSSWRP